MNIVLPVFTNPFQAMWWLFLHGGYVLYIFAILAGIWWFYIEYIQEKFLSKIQYVLLAVDVPKENEQTPKAVEHIFSHFHGTQKNPNKREKYIDGFVQPAMSIELISIGGYIQYLIRCPVENRDLVEAAIYAQYPNAEISEVEDYAQDVETKFPNDRMNLWGAELVMTRPDVYPIKTYPLWEHMLTQTFLDPMASILEILSRLRDGEQVWFQLVIQPVGDNAWRERGIRIINKLAGIKSRKSGAGLVDTLVGAPGAIATGAFETVTRTIMEPDGSTAKREKDEPPSLMQHLAPHVRTVIDAISIKISKLAFKTKFRVVYVAEHPVFDKSRVPGLFGALKQYASLDLNGFKPDKKMKTSRAYFRVTQRENSLKRRIVLGYRKRSMWSGRSKFMLNIEELASLWHFPVMTVKAPQVKKTEAKRGEPPVMLPVGAPTPEPEPVPLPVPPPPAPLPIPTPTPATATASKGSAPDNLPFA